MDWQQPDELLVYVQPRCEDDEHLCYLYIPQAIGVNEYKVAVALQQGRKERRVWDLSLCPFSAAD